MLCIVNPSNVATIGTLLSVPNRGVSSIHGCFFTTMIIVVAALQMVSEMSRVHIIHNYAVVGLKKHCRGHDLRIHNKSQGT